MRFLYWLRRYRWALQLCISARSQYNINRRSSAGNSFLSPRWPEPKEQHNAKRNKQKPTQAHALSRPQSHQAEILSLLHALDDVGIYPPLVSDFAVWCSLLHELLPLQQKCLKLLGVELRGEVALCRAASRIIVQVLLTSNVFKGAESNHH